MYCICDGNFSAGATVINATTVGADYVFTGNVPNGSYITFATNRPPDVGPGGVTTGLGFWLTGNQGVTGLPAVTNWEDQSGNNKNATGVNGSNPSLENPKINFNPALVFDGSKKMTITGGVLGTAPLTDLNFFGVSSVPELTNSFLFRESITGANGTNSRISAHMPWGDGISYFDVDASVSRIQTAWGGTLNIPNIWALPYSTTNTFVNANDKQNIVRDGLSIVNKTAAVSAITGVGGDLEIGSGQGLFHKGAISELFSINRKLTAGEASRIHSYLALKYGITLNQSTPTNYVASDGTTLMWNSDIAGAYNRDIAGIGRDDKSALAQKQSRSVNAGSIVTTYLGDVFNSNADNTFSFPADKRFFVWSNDNGSATFANIITTGLPAGIESRMTRVWRVDENYGDVGNTVMAFDLTGLGFPALGTGSYKLLVSSSNNFANATIINASALVNGNVYFDDVNLSDDQFFTLGYISPKAPGGVVNGLTLWLKANEGVVASGTNDVLTWTDQAKGNVFEQHNSNALPTYPISSLNFNPAVEFNGVNQALLGGSVFGTGTYTDVNTYQVITSDIVKSSFLYYETLSPARFSMHLPWGDGNFYFDVGNSIGDNRLGGAWGGMAGKPYLWSGLYSTNATAVGNKQQMLRDGLSIASDATATAITGTNQQFELATGLDLYHAGSFGDVAVYTAPLTALEHQRVQSYMAIKYGVTLDQTTAYDYLASDGTTKFFDATVSGNYKFDIAGIARDDASALLQKQSRSVNETGIVTIGLTSIATSNATNTGNLPTDKMSLVWAHNNLPTTNSVSTQLPADIASRMARVWRAEENNGETGTTEVMFDFTSIMGYNTNVINAKDNFFLLISNNGADFSSATKVNASLVNGRMVSFAGVNLNDNQFFTVGYNPPPSPGGVTGVGIWTGVVSGGGSNPVPDSFKDRSDNGIPVDAVGVPIISNLPADLVNFNKSPKLTGNEYYITDHNINATLLPQLTVVGVHKPTIGGAGKGVWGEDDGGWDRLAYNTTVSNGTAAEGAITGFMTDGKVSLGTVMFDEDVANGSSVFVEGKSALTFSSNHAVETSSKFVVGNTGLVTPFQFLGYLPEVITYTKKLNEQERQRVESYFAIKYGITLDQTPAQSYYASDWNGATGIRMWDASASGVFNKDIAGIARDDKGALYQKQSKSVNAGEVVTIGLGTIANDNDANTNTIAGDKRFLVWGNNGAGKDFASATYLTNLPTEVEYRMTRVWRVEENNGEVGNVAVWFDINSLGYPSADAINYKLLVSNDASNFSTATIVNADSFVGGIVKFSGVNLNDGQFFTFAYDCQLSTGTIAGNQFICSGSAPATFTSTTLPVGSSGVVVSYKWQMSTNNGTSWTDLANSNNVTYTHTALTNTTNASVKYLFRRVAMGCNDCTFASLEMPDVFTPNKDNKNDLFDLFLGVMPINAKMTVVDLRNNTVYESSNITDLMTKGWDGTMKNDGVNLAPSNVRYAWFVNYETPTGKTIKEKGYISIQR